MARKIKFTFKTHKPSGSYSSFFARQHDIKLGKKIVGSIIDSFRAEDHKFRVRLMVEKEDINSDGNPNCPWRWIEFKKRFDTLEEAKAFINKAPEAIIEKYPLHYHQD